MLQENLIGLIPAAGEASRLGLPFPKELYPTIKNNRFIPVSNYVVDDLLLAGVKHLVFVINETKHQLIGYYGSGQRYNCHFSYVVQENVSVSQSTSPGLANALASAYHLIKGKIVLFGMPDTIMRPKNVFKLGLSMIEAENDIVLCLFPTEYPENFGMVVTSNEGSVEKIIDKPKKTDLKYMWGCIIWTPAFSDFLNTQVHTNNVSDFADILNQATKSSFSVKSICFPEGKFIDFGTYDQISQFFENPDFIENR